MCPGCKARFHNSPAAQTVPALSRDVQNKPGGIISPSPSALAPADKETGNDYHDQDQPESCDNPRHIFALALIRFPFAFSAGTITWPSLKTALSTETNSGS